MPTKRDHEAAKSGSSSESLSPVPEESKKKKLKTKVEVSADEPAPSDAWQQITKPEFVDRYRVEGAQDVYYQSEFIDPKEAQGWYEDVLNLDTYQPTLKMYGRTFPQSRQIAAYSTTPNATLKYSGTTIDMNYPFPSVLEEIRLKLEKELGVGFNHVMLNRYDDGNIYIGKHSDNLNNLVIASISLGAERSFILSPRQPHKGRGHTFGGKRPEEPKDERVNIRWKLGNGSLVVMQGRTQEYWKHEIPKEPKIKTGRISLTFRQLREKDQISQDNLDAFERASERAVERRVQECREERYARELAEEEEYEEKASRDWAAFLESRK